MLGRQVELTGGGRYRVPLRLLPISLLRSCVDDFHSMHATVT